MSVEDLEGARIPDVVLLEGVERRRVALPDMLASRTVIFFYPATGVPGRDPAVDPAPGWDDIPGAAGCTAQNRRFRDTIDAFSRRDARVIGISTQPPEEQAEFAERERIPYRLFSDADLALVRALDLPTFDAGGRTFLRRMALFVEHGVIRRVFYPVAIADANADSVLAWLAENTAPSSNSGGTSSTQAR
ncbi:MAG TPA: peroxiredoxin [Thermoanaerobaculia bacterium]|nr:peroxiredoxin [Thermoanaerobaculia bacterium]